MAGSQTEADSAVVALTGITDELRATYFALAEALDLLRFTTDPAHPLLRQARRDGLDALTLTGDVKLALDQGVHQLRGRLTGDPGPAVRRLDTARVRLAATTMRVDRLRDRLDAVSGALTGEAAGSRWTGAAVRLDHVAEHLTDAVRALAAYTGVPAGGAR